MEDQKNFMVTVGELVFTCSRRDHGIVSVWPLLWSLTNMCLKFSFCPQHENEVAIHMSDGYRLE